MVRDKINNDYLGLVCANYQMDTHLIWLRRIPGGMKAYSYV